MISLHGAGERGTDLERVEKNGKPKMISVIPSILSSAIRINIKLHSIHRIMSIGYFMNKILIFSAQMSKRLIILFTTTTMKAKAIT